MFLRTLRPVLTPAVSGRDHARGPATADVTLVEYGDYQCPDCQRAQAVVRRLRDRLGHRLRVVFRHFPLTSVHPDAQLAAEAAEAAAAQGKFWEMHDHLFNHPYRLEYAALLGYARDLGLDGRRFANGLGCRAFAGRVAQDVITGVRSCVRGTPTFFVNGVRHDGPWDFESLSAAVRAAADGR
jgi:protein-disulfide isomerase